jgi:hypothetical protein
MCGRGGRCQSRVPGPWRDRKDLEGRPRQIGITGMFGAQGTIRTPEWHKMALLVIKARDRPSHLACRQRDRVARVSKGARSVSRSAGRGRFGLFELFRLWTIRVASTCCEIRARYIISMPQELRIVNAPIPENGRLRSRNSSPTESKKFQKKFSGGQFFDQNSTNR